MSKMNSPVPNLAPLRIGPLELEVPVVLAPMAGVTNAAFRTLCREFGGGLYVSEMITSRAILMGNRKTMNMASFAPHESPRSIQLYGTEPTSIAEATRWLVGEDRVDHIDLNFGCPAPKVTRAGGGAALPWKRRLFTQIVSQTVEAAGAIPVTVKMRMGINDHTITYLDAGRVAEDVGAAAVALHARTAEQLYSGTARWDAIGELKAAVTSIPVLGNGDIWEAADALEMVRQTGCDGVVVGRGCLGRPWIFRDLSNAFAGLPVGPPPRLGTVADTMVRHCALLCEHLGASKRGANGVRDFRKHTGWYLKGYPIGSNRRGRFSQIDSMDELVDLLGQLNPNTELPAAALRLPRGHTRGPKSVKLPDQWLDSRDDHVVLESEGVLAVSGG
jgi:nifR3 family TIM-barrel protein